MKAFEIEKHSVFSIDGGETWLISLDEPRECDNEKQNLWVAPRGDTSLSSSFHLILNNYDYVWEPDPVALNRGDNFLPVKESEY